MTRLALYRQYRPRTFGEVMGQDHIRDILKNAVREEKISHAYLFTGPRGTGKTSMARILARTINCEDKKDGEPCNTCNTCTEALQESLTDLIEMDAASHTGVDDMRDLIEKAQFAPTTAQRKVYIIDEVHMLSKSAFNALLKTLEEPPSNTHFILATTEAHKVLPTIVSRCQRFDFHRISTECIIETLNKIAKEEKIKAEEKALNLIANNAHGGLRDAISLFEQIAYKGELSLEGVVKNLGLASFQSVQQFVDAVKNKRAVEALTYINDLIGEGIDLTQFVNEVLLILRSEMLEAVSTGNTDEARNLIFLIDTFYESSFQLKDAAISQLPLEMAIIRACKEGEGAPTQETPAQSAEPEAKPVEDKKEEEPQTKQEAAPTPTKKEIKEELSDEKRFQAILSEIQKPSLKSILRQSQLKKEEGRIHIRVDSDFSKKKLEDAENGRELTESLKKYFGEGMDVAIEVSPKEELKQEDVSDVFGS